MHLTRRAFLASSALVLAAPSLAARRRADTFYLWTQVAPGLWAGQVRTGDNLTLVGGNALLATGTEGSLLIDTMQAVHAPSLRREALTKTTKITHVLNTHHHFDHAGGNAAFTPDCTVIGHTRCRDRLKDGKPMLAQLDDKIAAMEALSIEGATAAAADARAWKAGLAGLKTDAFECTKTLDADTTLELAGRTVRIHHAGAGHTDNDLFAYFPAENVLVTGDLVFNGLHPYFDVSAGATSTGWQNSLRRAADLCDAKTVVVPGHGAITDRTAITAQNDYFHQAREAVAVAVKAGKPRDEVAAMTLPGREDYALKIALPILLGAMYDEAMKK